MGHHDHGAFFLRQRPDDAQHFLGQQRVEGGGGLVEAEDFRVERQRAGNGHPLLLAAGKLVGVGGFPIRQAHLLQQLPGVGGGLFLVALQHADLGLRQVPQHVHMGEQVEVLEHIAHFQADGPLFPGRAVDPVLHQRLAVDLDGAAVHLLQVVEAAQQRALARAAFADDGDHFALVHLQGDVPQHAQAVKALFQMIRVQHGFSLLTGNNSVSFPPIPAAASARR